MLLHDGDKRNDYLAEELAAFTSTCQGMYVKPANKVKECGAQCFDGRDNDGDGKIDCSDPDCINNDSTCEHDPHQQTTRTSIPLHAAAVHHDSLPEAGPEAEML